MHVNISKLTVNRCNKNGIYKTSQLQQILYGPDKTGDRTKVVTKNQFLKLHFSKSNLTAHIANKFLIT